MNSQLAGGLRVKIYTVSCFSCPFRGRTALKNKLNGGPNAEINNAAWFVELLAAAPEPTPDYAPLD